MNEWSAEIDLATGMDDLNQSGFVVSKRHIKFETFDSQIAKANMTDFMRMIRLWDEKTYKKSMPNAHRQANGVSDLLALRHF